MAIPGNEIDANFYNLIYRLTGASGHDPTAERRDGRRKPFHSTERIAPCRGRGLPDESEFIEVQCHDLTGRGFSFFLPSPPDFDSLVAAFGTPPQVIYLAARVLHSTHVMVDSSGLVRRVEDQAADVGDRDPDGQTATPMVLVGCCFTERLHS